MKKRSELAVDKFLSGYNCAQSVLYAYCNDFQFDQNTALKLACGLGAGMGRKGEVCGAVTGGILVIGLKYGRGTQEDRTVTDDVYRMTRELIDKFEQRHSFCVCRNLLGGCNLVTDDGQKYFRENDLLNKVCKECVRSVVEILEKIV